MYYKPFATMKRVKITVKRMARYEDLMAEYENPIQNACDMRLGQTFVVENCQKPDGMCDSAWETLLPFVKELAEGGGNFFDGKTLMYVRIPNNNCTLDDLEKALSFTLIGDGFLGNRIMQDNAVIMQVRLHALNASAIVPIESIIPSLILTG